ncbi:hypothetical protein V4C53_42180 [Paraburkholderia azotifigens]|uniref:hypothetical protein n=1 Tax=Paraburkholderia azotifigens TaxID=2057004 RepID=UPI00317F2AE6
MKTRMPAQQKAKSKKQKAKSKKQKAKSKKQKAKSKGHPPRVSPHNNIRRQICMMTL